MLPLPPVDQSASAAVSKPLVALSHNEASATLSPLGSAPETVSLAQFLRDRNTSNEITDLGPERLAGSSELDKTRLQIDLLLTSRFHSNCKVARLRLAPNSKLFANSVSLQPFGFCSGKNCMTLLAGFAHLVMLVRHLLPLGVVGCLLDLFFVAIVSVASLPWLCL